MHIAVQVQVQRVRLQVAQVVQMLRQVTVGKRAGSAAVACGLDTRTWSANGSAVVDIG